MNTTRIKPSELKVGMRYRLTGDACDPQEARDQNTYKVMEVISPCRLGAHVRLMVEQTGHEFWVILAPWVPILRIDDPA